MVRNTICGWDGEHTYFGHERHDLRALCWVGVRVRGVLEDRDQFANACVLSVVSVLVIRR